MRGDRFVGKPFAESETQYLGRMILEHGSYGGAARGNIAICISVLASEKRHFRPDMLRVGKSCLPKYERGGVVATAGEGASLSNRCRRK
jgi:hypothetical protein